jgi:uncharacterized protein (DUF4213/DUF364 family)
MKILREILATLPDGEVVDVRIGLHWTAVVIEKEGERRCGLAATLYERGDPHQTPAVPQAGRLQGGSGRELAGLCLSDQATLTSMGVAAINAMLPRDEKTWIEANAEEVLARRGEGRRVALVGHFHFVSRLKERVGELIVLEQQPEEGDLPAEAASQVLPQANVIAITGMALSNHTLESLLDLCPSEAFVMLLGPSTPLSPLFFAHGVDWLSGAIVTAIDPVLHILSQGGNFRQLHPAGIRLVNICRE